MDRLAALLQKPLVAGIAGGLIAGLIALIAIAAGLVKSEQEAPARVAVTPPLSEAVADGEALSAADIYELAGPAVAFIEADGASGPSRSPFDPFPQERGTASGSGFLIDDRGHILTNAHVVEGSDEITVKLGEDGETLDAKLLGADSSTDVAVLEVDADEVGAVPLELGDSDRAVVGDAVVAIGNPFGLDRTVTTGIVSGIQREISAPDGFTISDVIQTDASINPGNSGGPLINASGEVIGINSQIATAGGGGSVGVGFAVPINTAQTVTEQILEDGEADHAFLGISGGDLTPELADVLNLGIDAGALIQEVTPDGPADEAGLRGGEATMSVDGLEVRVGGDVIVGVDGTPVDEMEDVVAAVNRKQPGDELELEVHRDGETKVITLELAERP